MSEADSKVSKPPIPDSLRASVLMYWQDAGQRWLDQLPDQIATICERWQLTLGPPIGNPSTAYVARAFRSDGTAGVLKILHPAMTGEAQVLRAYGTELAIEVIADEGNAMFLELATPGVPLRDAGTHEEIVDVTCSLMHILWQCAPPPGITTLRQQSDRFRRLGEAVLHTRPDLHAGDFEEGLAYLRELPRTTSNTVLLHGDLHPGNILSATRRPWLVTDPRPLVGEAEYEPMQLIIELAPTTPGQLVLAELVRRIEIVATRLGLSALRIAQWGVARRTDWALFCYGVGDDVRGNGARREMRLFAEATRVLR